MFEEVFGIPAHPLLVHAAVVFVPLQILAAFVYAFVPFVRHYIAWLVIGLAVVAPASALLAKESGEAFQERLIRKGTAGPELLTQIKQHSSYGDLLAYLSIGLALLMVLLVIVQVMRSHHPASTDADAEAAKPGKGSVVIAALLTIAVVAVGAATGYYAFKTGDTGAHMVWSGL